MSSDITRYNKLCFVRKLIAQKHLTNCSQQKIIDLFHKPYSSYELHSIELNMYIATVFVKHNYMLKCKYYIVIDIIFCL